MFALKLGAALVLGLLIGVDRQLRHKPLGIKTSMVISVASCLITMVSIEAATALPIPA
ncbi:putative membrane protein YhiD involved in acid resistance [Paenibacillus harenae]|uniref:Membrane protein YhiD involved in acid resistance n=1 Tax=Paenibacillus harenae TaxID=306543 RepID=A0ABT9TU56_PAEHA|nr:putative membrane protein YhiD involved in acid resistance [Paenibacillus harenae]